MNQATALRPGARISLALLFATAVWVYAPIFWEMGLDWYNDPNYSHGFLVPLIAGYFLFQRWPDLKQARVAPSLTGMPVILFGLTMLILGWVGTEYFTMRLSFVVLLAGTVLFLFGWPIFTVTALPILFLALMVPLPYIVYDAIAFPLKLFVTKVSVASLKLMGVLVWNEGNIIMFPNTTLEVADACSGLRSMMSLTALSVAYAFLMTIPAWKRLCIVLSAIPIAVATNALRVIATGFLAQYWGAKAAEGFFHEFAGLAVFGLGMVLLIGFGALLRRSS